MKSICILRLLYFEENFAKYIPAVLGKGQRGDGLAGSIDDMTLFIFAGVIEDHSAAGRVRHNTPWWGWGQACIIGDGYTQNALEFDLKKKIREINIIHISKNPVLKAIKLRKLFL